MKEYKLVILTTDVANAAEKFEEALNAVAVDGWRFSFLLHGHWVFMERDADAPYRGGIGT